MAVSAEFTAFVCDHLCGLGEVSARNMFGGAGVYCRNVMFALIAEEALYFKADEAMQAELKALDCGPFMYDPGKGEAPRAMGYWTIPDSAMDDPDEACDWGKRALDFALSKQKPKKPRR